MYVCPPPIYQEIGRMSEISEICEIGRMSGISEICEIGGMSEMRGICGMCLFGLFGNYI